MRALGIRSILRKKAFHPTQRMKLTEIARFVEDVAATTRFYSTLLGIEPSYSDDSIATFKHFGVTILIHARYQPGPDDLPCEDHIAFGVENLDQSVSDLSKKGMTLEFPPRDYDWGRSAYLRDPAGALVEINSTGHERQT